MPDMKGKVCHCFATEVQNQHTLCGYGEISFSTPLKERTIYLSEHHNPALLAK